MNKKSTIKTIITLLGLGFIAKLLSTIARILMTRELGVDGMGLYQLATPCMLLVITLAQFGLPTAIATLVSRHRNKAKLIFSSGLIIAFIIAMLMMILVIILAPTIAIIILKNNDLLLTIYALALLIPLVSLSAIIKGFFLGLNEIELTSTSTIMEEVGRIIFIICFLNFFVSKGANYGSFGAMLGVCVGEIFQTLYMVIFNDKKLYNRINELISIKKSERIQETKSIVRLSLPLTLSRLVGSVTYFVESIIVANLMLKYGMTTLEITHDYGILSGYVMPMLLMPGFFATSFANYLLPKLSSAIGKNRIKEAKNIFKKTTLLSGITGLFFSTIFFFFGDKIMFILYGTSEGYNLVRFFAFPFMIFYIEAPIVAAMHALDLTNKAFYATVISSIVRIGLLLVLAKKLHISAIGVSTIVAVFVDVAINGFFVIDRLFFHNEKIVLKS